MITNAGNVRWVKKKVLTLLTKLSFRHPFSIHCATLPPAIQKEFLPNAVENKKDKSHEILEKPLNSNIFTDAIKVGYTGSPFHPLSPYVPLQEVVHIGNIDKMGKFYTELSKSKFYQY